MKINLMGYDVEIKAKQPLLRSKFNKTDTDSFINSLIYLMYDSMDKAQMKCDIATLKGDTQKAKIYNDFKNLMETYANNAHDEFINIK